MHSKILFLTPFSLPKVLPVAKERTGFKVSPSPQNALLRHPLYYTNSIAKCFDMFILYFHIFNVKLKQMSDFGILSCITG